MVGSITLLESSVRPRDTGPTNSKISSSVWICFFNSFSSTIIKHQQEKYARSRIQARINSMLKELIYREYKPAVVEADLGKISKRGAIRDNIQA